MGRQLYGHAHMEDGKDSTGVGQPLVLGENKIIASGETHEGLMLQVLLPTQEFSIEKLKLASPYTEELHCAH
jgi:hypothetical protein